VPVTLKIKKVLACGETAADYQFSEERPPDGGGCINFFEVDHFKDRCLKLGAQVGGCHSTK
jgi:hypothetical protein